ncbi:hypothetical protein J3R30DRAFT_3216306, partial [Lentinula aciculospora]
LCDVVHCPSSPANLISIPRLTEAGYHVYFEGNTVKVHSKNGTLLAIGDKISHLYKLRIASQNPTPNSSSSATYAFPAHTWDEWH